MWALLHCCCHIMPEDLLGAIFATSSISDSGLILFARRYQFIMFGSQIIISRSTKIGWFIPSIGCAFPLHGDGLFRDSQAVILPPIYSMPPRAYGNIDQGWIV